MFGGLAFLIGGNMSMGASGQGALMARVDLKDIDALSPSRIRAPSRCAVGRCRDGCERTPRVCEASVSSARGSGAVAQPLVRRRLDRLPPRLTRNPRRRAPRARISPPTRPPGSLRGADPCGSRPSLRTSTSTRLSQSVDRRTGSAQMAYRSHRHRNAALPHWLRHYNERRPHSGIGNRPPISRVHNVCGQDN